MYKAGSSASTDILFGDGGLIWGYEHSSSPEKIIQSSFIEEMSTVSNEVKDLLETIKSRERELKEQENQVYKRQLKVDLKEKGLVNLQEKVNGEMAKLEKGALDTVVTLQNSIIELKKENQRLKDSFQSMSKNHAALKSEVEVVQSKNAKLEKQLSSANGRIKNLIKIQNAKIKEISENKENVQSPAKGKKLTKTKPQIQREDTRNPELIKILMRALSNIDQEYFSSLFEEAFQNQHTSLLSSLTTYLKQVTQSSAVVQYPVLKLTLKCIGVMAESESTSPTIKVIFRKIAEVLGSEGQYSNSAHLHSRLLSCLILSKTSLQIQSLQKSLKQILADVQEEGAVDIILDNFGHSVLLSCLTDPIQVKYILNILILLTLNSGPTDQILPALVPYLDRLLELMEEGDTETITSVSILLQRVSSLQPAKYRLKQSASLLRRMITEHSCSNSLVVLNCKAVLMNIDCFRQIPGGS